jgi:hypothetical protein
VQPQVFWLFGVDRIPGVALLGGRVFLRFFYFHRHSIFAPSTVL